MTRWKQMCLLVFVASLGIGCAQQSAQENAVKASHSEPIELTSLTQTKAAQWFARGHTQQQQVLNILGPPHGVSQVGDFTYWNYTEVKHDEVKRESNLVRLTLVFNRQLLLVDYDLQSNHFQQIN